MLAFDRQTDRQTDGRTNRRTEISSLDRVCIACSAVKIGKKTKLAKFPVIPAGNFGGPRFPGIPEREFPVALPQANKFIHSFIHSFPKVFF